MNLLSIRGLTKRYPGFALEDITLSLPRGRILGLIGRNGAGKSTTLKALLNLVRPDGGTIEMFGQNFLDHEESLKQSIGAALGEIDFYRQKKLAAISAVTRRFYPNWDEAAHQKYLQTFALDPQKRVKELSSGMKVKYMLALALSHNAKLFILDEPTSGLDPVSRDDLLRLFKQLVKDGERSILFSTHITSDLEKCADDIAYIKDGKLLRCAEKAAFLGDSSSLEEIMLRTEGRSDDL